MSDLDRRSLLRAGAAAVTVAPLLTFAPAEAGQTRTKVFKGAFRNADTADWHYLPFRVPRGVRKIAVRYSYRPTDTGAGFSVNVVDIGIFDPSGTDLGNAKGFRGWSGGARREFFLTRTRATPGYLAGPITPGTWHIALGPYLIVPPGTPYKVEVTLHFGEPGPDFVPEPAPQEVPGTGPDWYRGDLHLHTVHSDGRRTQPQLQAAALEAGLDLIGSSEHNTCSATRTWGRHVAPGFLVVNGEEVTTRTGHWLALGLPPGTWIDWRYRADDGLLAQFTEQVHQLGGVAVAAHPKAAGGGNGWAYGYDDGVDAIEVWNGPWGPDDQATVATWHALLVNGTYLPAIGNSDAHNDTQTVGLAQTVYRLDTLSTTAVLDAIRGGHAWIAESSAVDLVLTASAGGATAGCGDHLGAAPDATATVTLDVTGVPGCVAQLRGPASALGGALADEAGTIALQVDVPVAEAPFVRAEVRRTASAVDPLGNLTALPMVALTNPVCLGA
jgi:PHP-associated